ncbi:MAG: hypothetical protein QOI53_4525, partial [Verrucomicrobiota bacterium]|nr:hypothetical protein [Verrucomicrobiota bacterium]
MNTFLRILLLLCVGGFCWRTALAAKPLGGLGFVEVDVPQTDRTPPFDRKRMLKVPEGAKITVLTRVEKARFLAIDPQGQLLVSQPSSGKILLVKQTGLSETRVTELIS